MLLRRMRLVLAVALVMAALVVATAAPAFAAFGPKEHNPNYLHTPAANVIPSDGDEVGSVWVYNAPPASGGDPPKSGAKGGSPGSSFRATQCLKGADSCWESLGV